MTTEVRWPDAALRPLPEGLTTGVRSERLPTGTEPRPYGSLIEEMS